LETVTLVSQEVEELYILAGVSEVLGKPWEELKGLEVSGARECVAMECPGGEDI
jgi:hypothetical protein